MDAEDFEDPSDQPAPTDDLSELENWELELMKYRRKHKIDKYFRERDS